MNLVRAGLWFALSLSLVGCSRSEAAPSPVATHAASVSSGALHETANYKITIEPSGTYETGQEGVVKVVLVTKGDYHINDQYPYKLVAQDPPAEGVTYAKKVVRRADGKFDEKRAELPLRFTVARAGTAKVGGVLSLSVCTPSNCLMDKRPMALDITVK